MPTLLSSERTQEVGLATGRVLGRAVAATAAVVLLPLACSSEPAATAEPSATSSPFSVASVPSGFDLVTAGTGTISQSWGSDDNGSDEPFTVLSPDGRATGPDVVVVSATGFEGSQGRLEQASAGYNGAVTSREDVDGHPALYAPAGPARAGARAHWADLVVQRGSDLAVRVTSPAASRRELVEISRHVEPAADHRRAPTVTDPPEGLQVVGSVDADLVVALSARPERNTDRVPGSRRTHTIAWSKGIGGSEGRANLVVMTLPGKTVDVPAVAASRATAPPYKRGARTTSLEVDGRPGVAIEVTDGGYVQRVVVGETGWGDVVVVVGEGSAVPSIDGLSAVAASVRPIGDNAWARFVIDATGGPGLHADAGRMELERGRIGDLEWLLQTGSLDSVGPLTPAPAVAGQPQPPVPFADPCLKLSTGRRACAGGGEIGGPTVVLTAGTGGQGDLEGLPPFVVVTTDVAGTELRATVDGRSATGHLVELPGGEGYGGVVFTDFGGRLTPGCDPPSPEVEKLFTPMRIEVLAADGSVVGCIPQPR